MIKGMYAAASAMVAGLNRQAVLSHNIANVDTPGFKQVLMALDDYKYTSVTAARNDVVSLPVMQTLSGVIGAKTNLNWVGTLGLGVETTPEKIDFAQGNLIQTNQPLDLAIEGQGFFRAQTPDGERYTRDGRFLADVNGTLVTSDGHPVLSVDGGQITIPNVPSEAIAVLSDGTVMVNGETIAQIDLVTFENPEQDLQRDSSNYFIALAAPGGEEQGRIHQYFVESANVNLTDVMTQLMSVARTYEAAQQLVSVQDELLGRAISTLGRF